MLQSAYSERASPTIQKAVEDMLSRWRPFSETAQPFDLYAELIRTTTTIIGKVVLDIDLLDLTDRLSTAVANGLERAQRREMSLIPLPLWIPTKNNRLATAATATFKDIIHSQIRKHTNQDVGGSDILRVLMHAGDENGSRMTEEQIANQALTLLVAGHTTTATALSWLFYLLARNPRAQDKAAEEAINLSPEDSLHAQQLPVLKHVTACFYEALRLYPPSWLLHREALADDVIAGYKVKAGDGILICPFLLHRHPSVWSKPDEFEPDRFEPGKLGKNASLAFIPFGAGPRFCIGNHLAVLEARAIIAAVLRKYKINLVGNKIVEPYAAITLQPRGGVNVGIQPRG
jgi:cytochrome P450